MLLIEKRIYQIIERVSERTNGIIEPCLIDELSRYLVTDLILDFCAENNIIIGTEEPRTNRGRIKYTISHSYEMTLWLQCKSDSHSSKDEEKKTKAINHLLTMYQPKRDALMYQLFRGDRWIELEDAYQIAMIANWQILTNDKFQLHTAKSLDDMMLYQIKQIAINAYKDVYVDGINRNTSKDKIVNRIVKYVSYIDECDYESNQYTSAKNDDDIATKKRTKNGLYESDVECEAILWAAIDSLPEEDKEIFILWAERGCTQDEIAKMKGCSQVNIHKKLKKVAEQLREEIIF